MFRLIFKYKYVCTLAANVLSYSQTFHAAKNSLELQLEFIHTQHLHMVV